MRTNPKVPLSQYSDAEIKQMMREAIMRMATPQALSQDAMKDLYDEMVQRNLN